MRLEQKPSDIKVVKASANIKVICNMKYFKNKTELKILKIYKDNEETLNAIYTLREKADYYIDKIDFPKVKNLITKLKEINSEAMKNSI